MLDHEVRPDDISALFAAGEYETLEFKATTETRREATMSDV